MDITNDEQSDPTTVNDDSTPNLKPLFFQLPYDIRIRIWTLSFSPRHVEVLIQQDKTTQKLSFRSSALPPKALSICKESRQIALKHYTASFCAEVPFNPKLDTLYLSSRSINWQFWGEVWSTDGCKDIEKLALDKEIYFNRAALLFFKKPRILTVVTGIQPLTHRSTHRGSKRFEPIYKSFPYRLPSPFTLQHWYPWWLHKRPGVRPPLVKFCTIVERNGPDRSAGISLAPPAPKFHKAVLLLRDADVKVKHAVGRTADKFKLSVPVYTCDGPVNTHLSAINAHSYMQLLMRGRPMIKTTSIPAPVVASPSSITTPPMSPIASGALPAPPPTLVLAATPVRFQQRALKPAVCNLHFTTQHRFKPNLCRTMRFHNQDAAGPSEKAYWIEFDRNKSAEARGSFDLPLKCKCVPRLNRIDEEDGGASEPEFQPGWESDDALSRSEFGADDSETMIECALVPAKDISVRLEPLP